VHRAQEVAVIINVIDVALDRLSELHFVHAADQPLFWRR
jgi:hypothetical protein